MNNKIYKRLKNYVDLSRSLISEEGFKEIMHFFNHGEFEMAFEGLVIELMEAKKYPIHYEHQEWKRMGLEFKLDKDCVFDGNFWTTFEKWGEEYNN